MLPTFSWAQNFHSSLTFSALSEKPQVVQFSKQRSNNGVLELRHIQESPKVSVRIVYATPETKDLSQKILESDLDKISCDGDFTLTYDRFGTQYIQINSIKVCLDEDGLLIGHSFGIAKLKPEEITASTRIIENNRAAKKLDIKINQDTLVKKVVNPNGGVFIGHKKDAAVLNK